MKNKAPDSSFAVVKKKVSKAQRHLTVFKTTPFYKPKVQNRCRSLAVLDFGAKMFHTNVDMHLERLSGKNSRTERSLS